jgi:hypothetical protein
MFASIRKYKVKSGTVEELARRVQVGFVPLMQEMQGFKAVRHGVRAMEGADWIDVAAQNYPPECPGWVTLYQHGQGGDTPDTRAWRETRQTVEAVV